MSFCLRAEPPRLRAELLRLDYEPLRVFFDYWSFDELVAPCRKGQALFLG